VMVQVPGDGLRPGVQAGVGQFLADPAGNKFKRLLDNAGRLILNQVSA